VIINGQINLENGAHKYRDFVNNNQMVFIDCFKHSIYPGSLNITIFDEFIGIQEKLNSGFIIPDSIISSLLLRQPVNLGNLQIWKCTLWVNEARIFCYLARRVGSKVPKSTLELISEIALVDTFGLYHNEFVKIEL